jgi:hypothetical protein
MLKSALPLISAIAILALASCSSGPSTLRFSTFPGAAEVFTGKGGSMARVDGMDVWENGAPSRKLRLLGYISVSAKSETTTEQVVALARQQGGDTIVQLQPKEGVKYWAVYKYVK